MNKTQNRCQHVTAWFWEHYDVRQLCLEISLDIEHRSHLGHTICNNLRLVCKLSYVTCDMIMERINYHIQACV